MEAGMASISETVSQVQHATQVGGAFGPRGKLAWPGVFGAGNTHGYPPHGNAPFHWPTVARMGLAVIPPGLVG